MSRIRSLVGVALALWFEAAGWAASSPVTGVLDFAEPVRATGMGGAGVAVGADPVLGGLNPAAAAGSSRPIVALAGSRGAFDDLTGSALGALPVAGGVVSLAAAYLDAGRLDYVTPTGVSGGVSAQRDLMASVRVARPVTRRLAFGGAVTFVHSELFETARARSLTADLGIRARLLPWLVAGAAYRGLGGAVSYGSGAWRLPSGLRAGVAGEWSSESGRHAVIALADAEQTTGLPSVSLHLGAEYVWRGLVVLRAGAAPAANGSATGFGGGFGLSHGRLRLDYGIRLGGPAATPHRVSLTVLL